MNLLKLTLCLVNKVWHPTWMSFFSRDAMDRNFILHTMNHEYSKQARKKGLFPCSTHCLGRFVVISFRKQPFIMLVSLSVLLIYVLASSATYNFAWKI